MKVIFLALPVLFLTAGAIVAITSESRPARTTFKPQAVNRYGDEAPLQLPQAAPETGRDWASIIASLPSEHGLVRDAMTDWLDLESALVTDPEVVRPLLEARYASEGNPTYKGLLAILLSTDPGAHARILTDWRSHIGESWVLFRALAVFALTKVQPQSIENSGPCLSAEGWNDLFRVAEVEELEKTWRREERENPELGYRKMMSCSASMMHLDRRCHLSWKAAAILSPAIRSALMAGYDDEEQWAQWCIENAVASTAAKDPKFAESIVRDYIDSGLRDRALLGFEFIGRPGRSADSAVLSPEALRSIEEWAMKSVQDDDVFKEAVGLLGHQKRSETEIMLLNLYGRTEGRIDARSEVLDAMASHGAASFQGIAEAELRGRNPDFRIAALRILCRMSTEESLKLILQTAMTDQQSRMRCAALRALQERNVWSREEEQVLSSLLSDPSIKVRRFAMNLHTAQDRSTVDAESLSSWNWPRPGEKEPDTSIDATSANVAE